MKKVIISLGGSLIYPEKIDLNFLKQFRDLILSIKGTQFILICGGGKLARDFQDAASSINKLSNEEKDWLGIAATRLNAQLVKSIIPEEIVYNQIASDPTQIADTDKKIIVCSGWKPGWSTDYDAVLIAKNMAANMVINMSNINYVYDSDPKKNPSAKPLKNIGWKDFRDLVGDRWSPGLNMPFDPIASKEAEQIKLKVVIIGKDLANLKKLLSGKSFEGTIIN